MRVGAIQMASGPQVAGNLHEAARLIAKAAAAGAKLVVLPENFALMPVHESERLAAREQAGSGPIQSFLAEQARMHGIWLVGGTIPLAGAGPLVGAASLAATAAAGGGERIRAACLIFDDRGRQVARYDKMHLFDVVLDNGEQYHESKTFEPGSAPVVVDTPFGKLGIAICYDLRFPELFRRLLDQGAELFAIPSAFTALTGKAHWEILVRARAIENLAYVIAAAQGGYHINGRETHGDSMIVNPWGEVQDRLARGSGVVIAELDQRRQARVRETLPALHHRRIYAN